MSGWWNPNRFIQLIGARDSALLTMVCAVIVPLLTPGCGDAAVGEPRGLEPCIPECAGKECGDDGCGGSCGTCSAADTCNNISGLCVTPVGLVWTDSIQSGSSPWGFDNLETQHPIDVTVAPSDANGANLSRVPDPLGGAGYAMRQFGRFDQAGARSQLALWSGAFDDLATSGQAVYIAQEWYFPEALSTDSWGWLALWDWHSTGPSWGENRWHAAPSLNLLTDGSMRVVLEWGGTAADINGWTGGQSSIGLPVGEWFDIEMRYQWTAQTTTISVWVNGELFLEQSGVQTRDSDHAYVETYIKLYGESDTAWSPTPSIKYTRNVRISGERIWQ